MQKIDFRQTDTAGTHGAAAYCSGTTPLSVTCKKAIYRAAAGSTPVIFSFGGNPMFAAWELIPGNGVRWLAGTWEFNLNLTTAANARAWAATYICRVNSSGVNQESLGSTTGQNIDLGTTGIKTMNVTGSAPSALSDGDKIMALLIGSSSTMGSANIAYTPDQLIKSPFVYAPGAVDALMAA